MKKIIIAVLPLLVCYLGKAQNTFHISGANVVQSGGNIVITDGNFINNGTFNAISGNVTMEGTSSGNSTIEGTSVTTFNGLTVNRATDMLLLENNAAISGTLNMVSGLLDIQAFDLTIMSSGTISGTSGESFVRTSGLGTLIQTVAAAEVTFPVGKNSYTPARLSNSGTSDVFDVRVTDEVFTEGTSGILVDQDNVDLTWFINEGTAGGSDASLTLQWNTAEELTGFNRTACFVTRYDGSEWSQNTLASASGSDPYTRSLSGITEFSPFTVSSNSAVLPVELLSFTARKRNNQSILEWSTATEINNDYFDIEWSTDGETFEHISSQRGAGTTNVQQNYQDLHSTPAIGLNYYRLKQVDFNGSFQYSNVEVLHFKKSEIFNLLIYPNPADHYLIIQSSEREQFRIMDIKGRIIKEGLLPADGRINLMSILPGNYILNIGNKNEKFTIVR